MSDQNDEGVEERKKEEESASEGDASLENTLKENARTFLASALKVYESGDITSATILYFKALFAILDFVILKKKGIVPKDHSERFRILEKEFPELYTFVDAHFDVYQDTYRTKIRKEECDIIKEYVERVIKEQGI